MEKKKTRKRDTSQKRLSILEAAVQAYQEEGYYHASMDRIAEIAGASKRTVYNHFKSKDDLFQAVISKYLEDQQSHKQIKYDKNQTMEDQLSEFVDAELFLVNHPDRLGLAKVLTSVFLREPELAIRARAACQPPREPLKQWLQAAQKDGKLQISDTQISAAIFYSMVEGALTWPALFSGYLKPEILEPLRREIIATFLCRYSV